MAKKILITGGAGYIGSHTALELLNEGYEVVVYDNLCNSSKESLKRVEELSGKHITFYEGDVMDETALKAMMEKEGVDAVIHCAALKAVGESVQKPLEYYRNNITGTLTLMDVMKQTGVKNIVFSSSATVYGSPEEMPITEECPKGQCTNPYGWTKSMMEQIMTDVQKANPDMNVILLRHEEHRSNKRRCNFNDICKIDHRKCCDHSINQILTQCPKCKCILYSSGNLSLVYYTALTVIFHSSLLLLTFFLHSSLA